jgi:hypothetical protein
VSKLTLREAKQRGMSWRDVIRHYVPDASDEFCALFMAFNTNYTRKDSDIFSQIEKKLGKRKR